MTFWNFPFSGVFPGPGLPIFNLNFGDRKGTTKKLCDKDFAERSGELSGAICLKTLVLLGKDPVAPSNCSDNSLVLLVGFFGFVSLFGS